MKNINENRNMISVFPLHKGCIAAGACKFLGKQSHTVCTACSKFPCKQGAIAICHGPVLFQQTLGSLPVLPLAPNHHFRKSPVGGGDGMLCALQQLIAIYAPIIQKLPPLH